MLQHSGVRGIEGHAVPGVASRSLGLISDALQAAHGAESQRVALLVVAPLYVWSAAHYFVASRTVLADLRAHAASSAEAQS